jgi:hypothetical protein
MVPRVPCPRLTAENVSRQITRIVTWERPSLFIDSAPLALSDRRVENISEVRIEENALLA